jgi:hypothetical protein
MIRLYRTGSLLIQGEPTEAVSSYAFVDIIAPNFDTDSFSFVKAAKKSGDDPSFEIIGNFMCPVYLDCVSFCKNCVKYHFNSSTPIYLCRNIEGNRGIAITPPSSHEQSIVPQMETPKISEGKGGAVFRGNVELEEGSSKKNSGGGSLEIEKGPSLFSNEDASTLVILRSNSNQQLEHHATVLIQQKALPEQPII